MKYYTGWAFRCGVVLLVAMAAAGYGKEVKIPDFTKGEKLVQEGKDAIRARMLGPTGLWAFMYSKSMDHGGTRLTRQFLVSKVEAGSPADGKIITGDVILGVDGRKFDSDARKVFAAAVEKAEATDGVLSLAVWRPSSEGGSGNGRFGNVTLKLRILGAHSKTCPYNCPKCEVLVDLLAEQTKTAALPPKQRQQGQSGLFMPSVYALGMLATGREDLMPDIKAYAHTLCAFSETGTRFDVSTEGKRVWHTGYNLIFLSEYYMATGDEYVLPSLKEIAVGAAKGQSAAGTYGHRFSSRRPDGGYHGPLIGYGAINNAALTMLNGLLLARKCGVEHEEINRAVAMGKRFFDFFVEHGTIPYGDHWAAYEWLDNNGINAQAAVTYGLMGDARGQHYFSSLAVASASTGGEEGHQGVFWSHLWGGLGAVRSGAEGAHAFARETRYIRTLERSWKGQMLDQGSIGLGRHSSMVRGDVTGERLLLYSLGRRKLFITGKGLNVSNPLTGQDLQNALEAGRLTYDEERREALSEPEIFALLEHELPQVRNMAGKILQDRDLNRVDKLIGMLDSNNRFARYGACRALAHAGYNSPKAVAALAERLEKDEDILFRYYAVDALASTGHWRKKGFGLREVAAPAVPLLLKLASGPVPNDPRGHLTWRISEALFYNKPPLTESLPSGRESDALIVAGIRQFLVNENGRSRQMVPFDKLTEEQLEPLWPTILDCVREGAPSGVMFSFPVRTSGLSVLAKYRIKEGLDLMMELAVQERDESTGWVPWFSKTLFAELPKYGKAAQPVLDVIEQWPILVPRAAEYEEPLAKLRKQIAESETIPLKRIKK